MTLFGMPVILSPHLTEAGQPILVKRTWKERLFSRPWRPFVATRLFTPQVPSKQYFQIGNKLVMHPQTWIALQNIMQSNASSNLTNYYGS